MADSSILEILAAVFSILATSIAAAVGIIVKKALTTNGGVKLQRKDEAAIQTTMVEITNIKNELQNAHIARQAIRTDINALRDNLIDHISDRTAHP